MDYNKALALVLICVCEGAFIAGASLLIKSGAAFGSSQFILAQGLYALGHLSISFIFTRAFAQGIHPGLSLGLQLAVSLTLLNWPLSLKSAMGIIIIIAGAVVVLL